MARPRKTIRPVEKNISLPEDIVARIDLELFSEVEGKVPFGAWQKYILRLVTEDFARQDAARQDTSRQTSSYMLGGADKCPCPACKNFGVAYNNGERKWFCETEGCSVGTYNEEGVVHES